MQGRKPPAPHKKVKFVQHDPTPSLGDGTFAQVQGVCFLGKCSWRETWRGAPKPSSHPVNVKITPTPHWDSVTVHLSGLLERIDSTLCFSLLYTRPRKLPLSLSYYIQSSFCVAPLLFPHICDLHSRMHPKLGAVDFCRRRTIL